MTQYLTVSETYKGRVDSVSEPLRRRSCVVLVNCYTPSATLSTSPSAGSSANSIIAPTIPPTTLFSTFANTLATI